VHRRVVHHGHEIVDEERAVETIGVRDEDRQRQCGQPGRRSA
jgi:hypothetical protein